ncbi:MAG: DUF1080 domain-containing protein [Verrucomicrobia bacterium]|nr:DUF1080 domain-containing protein [Verrucomicrobiota bacterium]
MKTISTLVASLALTLTLSAADAEKGFKSIFNGHDLTGWEGNPELWSVKDGCINGQTTAEKGITHNTFLIWKAGTPGDFELRCSWKLTSQNEKGFGNSGIQYRSKVIDPKEWIVGGYQADIATDTVHTGILYEERGRGILANCGEKVVIKGSEEVEKKGKKSQKPKLEATRAFGTVEEVQGKVKKGEWNTYVIIAKGNHLQQFINGAQTVDITDEDAANAAKSGVLALQLHVGGAMTIQFKDLRLKELK